MGRNADSAESDIRRHRALADPTRARALQELRRAGSLDTGELAARLGLHRNTVRAHLRALADAGLVERTTATPRGRGRPRTLFRATAANGGERRYELLAGILTALVARFGPEAHAQLEDVGEAWGRYLVESPPPFARLADADALERLLAMLADIGFQPALADAEGGLQLRMRPCPFLELARQHQGVICPIHLGLIRGALAELGARTTATRLDAFVEPDLCIARLAATEAA